MTVAVPVRLPRFSFRRGGIWRDSDFALLIETIGEGEANPTADGGVGGGAPDGLLCGLVQARESRGAQDLHGLD